MLRSLRAQSGRGQDTRKWATSKIANLIFGMHNRDRHVKAHGAAAKPRTGHHSFAAACVFAKDILKAFMAIVKEECPWGKPWDYADDITFRVERDAAAACAEQMYEELERLKHALRRDGMVFNDGKQQVLGLTKEVRDAWRQYGEVAQVAKDVGVRHDGYKEKRPELDATLAGLQRTNQRIRAAGGSKQVRCTMMAPVVYDRCLWVGMPLHHHQATDVAHAHNHVRSQGRRTWS